MSVGSGVERLETAVFGCLAFAESEVQLLVCSCVTLVFSAVGFLSPVHRGSILQVRCGKTCRYLQISSNPGPGSSWFHLGRGCCCFSPSPVYWQARSVVSKRANACRVFRLAGYTSARFYKMWKGEERAIYIYIHTYIYIYIYLYAYIYKYIGNLQLHSALLPGLEEDDPPHSFVAGYSALAAACLYFQTACREIQQDATAISDYIGCFARACSV